MNLTQSKIALLATGDELITGDILNTNGQAIAQILKDQGFLMGMHVIASDNENEITKAIDFLLADHSILIIIGGLGPTSDDRTRFALSQALNKPLIFDETTWQQIINRLTSFHLHIHKANKQQALFPENSDILQNPYGTANGCMLQEKQKLIFMLPGPPHECLPMFENYVLPKIKQQQHQIEHHLKWRLFGVSEGEIAATLDDLVKSYPVITGYRWYFPYLEFKIRTLESKIIPEVSELIEKLIAPHIICAPDQSASEFLKEAIANFPGYFIVNDNATGGLLQSTLTTIKSKPKLFFNCGNTDHYLTLQSKDFSNESAEVILVTICGLDEVWQSETPTGNTNLIINIEYNDLKYETKKIIPFRNRGVLLYAVEFICYQINQVMSTHKPRNECEVTV